MGGRVVLCVRGRASKLIAFIYLFFVIIIVRFQSVGNHTCFLPTSIPCIAPSGLHHVGLATDQKCLRARRCSRSPGRSTPAGSCRRTHGSPSVLNRWACGLVHCTLPVALDALDAALPRGQANAHALARGMSATSGWHPSHAFGYGHITYNAPDLIRTPKLNCVEPA